MKIRHLFSLITLLAISVQVYAQEIKPRIMATFDLEEMLSKKPRINVEVGTGVSLQATTGSYGEIISLKVEDQRQTVKEFTAKDSLMRNIMTLSRIEVDGAHYFALDVFTGGAHCCLIMHFFAKPDRSQRLRYLGATASREVGDGVDMNKSIFLQNGQLFLEWEDSRFSYFHTSYAKSQLFFPIYYRLTPTSLTLDNTSFKDRYVKQIGDTENQIRKLAVSGRKKPATILSDVDKGDFTGGFTDELGQLLVKRTILHLYAGEEDKAWQSLATDLQKYYKSDRGLATLKSEIRKTLSR